MFDSTSKIDISHIQELPDIQFNFSFYHIKFLSCIYYHKSLRYSLSKLEKISLHFIKEFNLFKFGFFTANSASRYCDRWIDNEQYGQVGYDRPASMDALHKFHG